MEATGITLNFDIDYISYISFNIYNTSECIKIIFVKLNEICMLDHVLLLCHESHFERKPMKLVK
jgi:hypothetical protein